MNKHVYINFKQFSRVKKPNNYLLAPKSYCLSSTVDEFSPVLNVGIKILYRLMKEIMVSLPRTVKVFEDEQRYQLHYVQRSFLCRFPDIIYLQLISLNEQQSTLLIYSAACYGYSDFGVNKKRVRHILHRLSREC